MTGLHGKADDLINFLRGAAGVMSRISPVVKIPFSNIGRQHRMCKQNSFKRWLFFKRLHGTVINQMMCSLFTGFFDRQAAGLSLCGMVVDPTGSGLLMENHNSLPEPDVSHGCDVPNSGS
jgi:hypothetical protein